jgi:hypothetical protein
VGNNQVKKTANLLLWIPVLLLTACSSLPPASPSPGNLVNVGGYEMYLLCMGTGTPTVIMEAGLNDVAA